MSAKAEAQQQRAELALVSLTSVCLRLHTWLSTLSDSCALQVRQELQEVTRQVQNDESAQPTQVNTGCACINCIGFHFPVWVFRASCVLCLS